MLSVFDPKVTREQMYLDLGKEKMDKMQIEDDPYLCCAGARSSPHPPRHNRAPHARRPQPPTPPTPRPPHTLITALTLRPPRPPPPGAHAIAVMTEWDVFKKLDLQKIYDAMQKPVSPRVLKPAPQPQPPAPAPAPNPSPQPPTQASPPPGFHLRWPRRHRPRDGAKDRLRGVGGRQVDLQRGRQ